MKKAGDCVGDSSKQGRILCVTSNFPRWSGDSTTPYVLNLANDLQDLGWHMSILAPHAPGAARQETINGLQVERFPYFLPASQQNICYQGGMLINLRKNPLNFLKVPAFVGAEAYHIHTLLKKGKYDLLHTHSLLPQGLAGALATLTSDVPHVATVHGSDVLTLSGRVANCLKRLAAKRSQAVTVNSSATKKAVEELNPAIRDLHRIPMGIDTDSNIDKKYIHTTHEQYRIGQGPIVAFVGRLVQEKGVADLLHAVSLLINDFPEIKVLLAGVGQDKVCFEEMSKALGLDEHVDFIGWVAPHKVISFIAAADVYVSPSWSEGQGLTCIEAMMAETPVVATAVGGIVDTVQHEQSGLLVEAGNPQQIAQAITRILRNPELGQRMCSFAKSMAQEKFNRQDSAQAFSELFEDVLSRGRAEQGGCEG